jgi:hypothetical protein
MSPRVGDWEALVWEEVERLRPLEDLVSALGENRGM